MTAVKDKQIEMRYPGVLKSCLTRCDYDLLTE